jgi:hypothetical protein
VFPYAFNTSNANTPVSTDYGDRLNQTDLRVGKIIRYGRTRTSVNVDLFNVFNQNAATAENATVQTFR